MLNKTDITKGQPILAKYSQLYRNGVQSIALHRNAIGYVLSGKTFLHYGDEIWEVEKGKVYYLGIGHHYVENIPDNDSPFEQIVFYYDSYELNKILNNLRVNYGHSICNDHACELCERYPDVVYPAWKVLRNFFLSVNNYIKEGVLYEDQTAEKLKLTELIYLIISNKDCCIKNKIIRSIDVENANFEQIVNENIFNDISVDEMAHICNMSLTSFKKEFKRRYLLPPHKWQIKQRLMHARLLLISTNRSVSEIGVECNFPNSSHFIRLFKSEFGETPVSFRNKNNLHEKYSNLEPESDKKSAQETLEYVL